MTQKRNNKKKSIEYHFVDINDPNRYKKLKVARACDFCRKRKSKCDVGIPGSGTCSNCIKSKNECIFSPVSESSTPNKIIISRQQKKAFPTQQRPQYKHTSSSETIQNSSSNSSNSSIVNTIRADSPLKSPTSPSKNMYQIQNSLFSMDARGFCGYEHHTASIYNHMIFASSMVDAPQYTHQMEKELFQVYFDHVHPYFPVLDRFYIMQPPRPLPRALKLAILAIAMYFTHTQDAQTMASTLYHHATLQLDHTPTLLNVQTLFLLYKFQELNTPVGLPLSVIATNYLKEIQSMLAYLQEKEGEEENIEFHCRASWLLYIIVSLSSPADERWESLLKNCQHPHRFPALTEREQYDPSELNVTCHFNHLIHLVLLFSQTMRVMAHGGTLFRGDHPEIQKVATRLRAWKSGLPDTIALNLAADPYESPSHAFISYLGLLCDILELVIDLHQPMHDISKRATRITYRAHRFVLGDMLDLLRKATIQGSRLVCYGLTLATQAQALWLEHKGDAAAAEDINTFYAVCSLSFQVLDEIPLSSQLYMTIQSLRLQFKAKEQLNTQVVMADQHGVEEEDHCGVQDHTRHTSYYFTESHRSQATQPHVDTVPLEDRQWQYYHQQQNYDYETQFQPHTMTPEFEQEIITPELETLPMVVESYFDRVPRPVYVNRTDPCVSVALQGPFQYFTLNITQSKSCKNHTLL